LYNIINIEKLVNLRFWLLWGTLLNILNKNNNNNVLALRVMRNKHGNNEIREVGSIVSKI
jgi:hypothetical protein